MKRLSISLILIILIIITGCETINNVTNKLSNATSKYAQGTHNGIQIYEGQSAESLEKALGAPDVVSSGMFSKNANNVRFLYRPMLYTTEWVYIGPEYSTIVYIFKGKVSSVHKIPTSKVNR